jgi:hypothetical protein
VTTGFLCWRTGDLPRSSLEQASLYPRTTDLILSDPDTQRRLVKAPTSALPKMVGKLRYLLPPSLNCCEAFGASWQTTAFSKWQQRVSKATPNCASDPTAPPLTMKKLRQALRKIWVTAGVSPRETPPDGISVSPQTASNLEVGISSSNELPRGGPRRSTSSGSEINGTSRSLRNGSRTHDLTLVPARPPPERGPPRREAMAGQNLKREQVLWLKIVPSVTPTWRATSWRQLALTGLRLNPPCRLSFL